MLKIFEEIKKLIPVENIENTLESPPDPSFGDVASTVCFSLARQLKKPPARIAEEIVQRTKPPKNSVIERIEAKGGYVNFFFNRARLAQFVIREAVKKAYGKPKPGGKKMIVEHTSVNPNKALHVGHIRNSCLGDSIVRTLKFAGNRVQEVSYIDDSGSQLADLLVGFRFLNIPMTTSMKFDQYCGNEVYVRVNKVYGTKPELQQRRGEIIKEIERGGNETSKLAAAIVEKVLRAQLETLSRMGIGFDLLVTETAVLRSKMWEEAFQKLRKTGAVYKETDGRNAGCWLLKLSDRPEFADLENADKILSRSDGTVLYTGKDIAYAMWKHGLLEDKFSYKLFGSGGKTWITSAGGKPKKGFGGADKSVAIVDVRQSYAQDVVAAALEMTAGRKIDYNHYDYGVVALSRNTAEQLGVVEQAETYHMSGRKGLFVNVDDVLAVLEKKAYEETKKRNADSEESWLRETSRKIARSALRYEMIKVDRENVITFDTEESLRLDGNTAPYLQYAYARSVKILEKAGRIPKLTAPATVTDTESEIIKNLMNFPATAQKAATGLAPQEICRYAFNLCALFNRFYQDSPVLQAEGKTRAFRLNLVKSFVAVLGKCFALAGIDALDRM
ncbi:MAG: arginine--tRNA ligase [Candidatus Aenigmarchaeota archaeon]|nr:arginine--tRNA ligase [Candidatus Aenigmarchaeota archaeon]